MKIEITDKGHEAGMKVWGRSITSPRYIREYAEDEGQIKVGNQLSKTWRIILGTATVAGLTGTSVSAVHCIFFFVPDELLWRLVSFLVAFAVIMAPRVFVDRGEYRLRLRTSRISLSIDILIAGGSCLTRIYQATTAGEYVLSLALMLMDVGLAAGLETAAKRVQSTRTAPVA